MDLSPAQWANVLSSYHPINSFKLEPVEVRIFGNVAIVQYYWSFTYPGAKVFSGRNTVTFIKQDGKWKALGGMSASCLYPAPCLK